METVLLVHNSHQHAGGEDRVFAEEGKLLEQHGHRVLRFTLDNSQVQNMSWWDLARRTVWNHRIDRSLRDLFRRHRPAVAHFHNTFPLISPAGYYAARASGVAVVQTLHNYRLLCPAAVFMRRGRVCEDCLRKSFAWPAVLHGCDRSSRSASAVTAAMLAIHRAAGTWQQAVDVYIALTQFAREKFIQGGLPEDRIAVKGNFVIQDPGPGSGDGGYALFVGRLAQEKGVAVLLDGWRKLRRPYPLKIVGDGSLAPLVQQAVAANPAIQWLGQKPIEEVYDLIGGASFLVLPSICYESFPKIIAEGFAKGTPILAADLGSMTELIQQDKTGWLFEPGDGDQLAQAVERIIGEPELWGPMRQAARQEFLGKHTAAQNYRMLHFIYQTAMQRAATHQQGPE